MEGVRKRLAVGAIWTAGGRVMINLIGLASTLVLARLLTPEDFGLVAIGTIVFAVISAFTEVSLGFALIQHRDPQREHYDTAWTLNLLRSLVIGAVLIVCAYPVAIAYDDNRIVAIMCLLAATALVSGLINPRLVDFRRNLSFQQEMFTELLNKTVGFIVGASIAYLFRSYWALVFGYLAAQVTSVIISYALIPFVPRFSLKHWRSLFSFSSWLALSAGMNAINYRADQLALGAMLGTAPLGQYTVGDNLASLPVREATAPLAHVLFPAFARLQDDQERMRETFLRSQRLFVATALPVGVGFALVAEPLVRLALGPQWMSAALVIQVLSTIFAIHAFAAPFTPLAMALGRTRLLFVRDIIFLAVRYPLIFVGLFSGGLMGLLIARCVSGVIGISFDIYLARKLVGARVITQIMSSWRALAATCVMAAIVSWLAASVYSSVSFVDLGLLVSAGAISYFGTTLVLWLVAGKPSGPEREVLDILHLLGRHAAGKLGHT